MLIILSPAKSLYYITPIKTSLSSQPKFAKKSEELIFILKKFSEMQLRELMGISESLAKLNSERFKTWSKKIETKKSRQAFFAFNGDVYEGLDIKSISLKNLEWAQNHVRILSGLYGVLKPLDLIQPHRLEMGTKLNNKHGKNLYEFWGNEISDSINETLSEINSKYIVNLASDEYFKAINKDIIKAKIIKPIFEDQKNGQFKVISFNAKKARGQMARFIIMKKLINPKKLINFTDSGYKYSSRISDEKIIFRRY